MADAEKKPAEKKKEGKQKKPSALKRDQQSERRKIANRSYRASVQTAIRGFQESIANKESADSVRKKLDDVFSLMDKGVKKGVYKRQKAARTKSRLSARA